MALALLRYLRKAYPKPKSELQYETPFQFVVAVILSAQCTDKMVNRVTQDMFARLRTPADFARMRPTSLERMIASVTFYKTKAKHIIGAAKQFKGLAYVDLVALPGVGYKTAHVIRGELLGVYDGIPTDTHVRRFARRFGLTKHSDLKKISKDLEALIPHNDWKYVNNGLVLYGRYTCPARSHDCTNHPLTALLEKGRPYSLPGAR